MKKCLIILLFLCAILSFGYFVIIPFLQKIEVNTVSPQSSPSIESSKKNGFYVERYKVVGLPDSLFKINEAWVEYVWKNEYVNGKIKRVKQNELQLNLKPDSNFPNSKNFENYFIAWKMIEPLYGTVGTSSGGVYTLYLRNHPPDTFTIIVNRIFNPVDENPQTILSFKVVKVK